jgi:hypothetical protein
MLRIGIVAPTKMSGPVATHVDWNPSCRRNGNEKVSHQALEHLLLTSTEPYAVLFDWRITRVVSRSLSADRRKKKISPASIARADHVQLKQVVLEQNSATVRVITV